MAKHGYCGCGCGGKTNPSPTSHAARGYVKGQPRPYIHNHHTRVHVDPLMPMPPCLCGCQQPVSANKRSERAKGMLKGVPTLYIVGHRHTPRLRTRLPHTWNAYLVGFDRLLGSDDVQHTVARAIDLARLADYNGVAIREPQTKRKHPELDGVLPHRDIYRAIRERMPEGPSYTHTAPLQPAERTPRPTTKPKREKRADGLTRRQWEVVALSEAGLTSRQIAKRLRCAASTVRSHLASAGRKAGADQTPTSLPKIVRPPARGAPRQ